MKLFYCTSNKQRQQPAAKLTTVTVQETDHVMPKMSKMSNKLNVSDKGKFQQTMQYEYVNKHNAVPRMF